MERLQKVLAKAGIASRRECEKLIINGSVKVNDQIVTELGTRVDPDSDRIEVHNQVVQVESKQTFLFYKPQRVITSMHDPKKRKVVAHYFKQIPERVYPVGRLDYDTEGLLIVTNDGELANRLMHPRYEIEKTYVATVKGKPRSRDLQRLQKGVRLEDGWTAPAQVQLLGKEGDHSLIEIRLHEGRNRQVRRMFEQIGHPVTHLIRTQIAFLTLDGLSPGQYRSLESEELKQLHTMLTDR